MIAFDLICSNGHRFECWFKDSPSFEKQKSARMIDCPVCSDRQVEKIFSSFGIRKNVDKKKARIDPQEAMRHVQNYLEKNFEDVGVDFAKEALKMHYGKSKERNIKGTATADEEVLLKKEGIQFIKVPIIKRLDN
jgi:hypothetical protein